MDVCITHDYDGLGSDDFSKSVIVRASKAHKCCECEQAIAKGQRYERCSGKSDGEFFSESSCLRCTEIRRAFVCGAATLGFLWESMEWDMFPLWRERGPFECLAKLTTVEARDLCRARFDEWEREQGAEHRASRFP
jgi:hypothetical protein